MDTPLTRKLARFSGALTIVVLALAGLGALVGTLRGQPAVEVVTAAVVALRRGPWGLLVTGSMLAMYVLECLSIAVDQWFGAHADPASPITSAALTPVFAVAAALIAAPLAAYLRHVDRDPIGVAEV
ncbi:hypothetical protein V5P93_004148 [Actinokineospora auranticolor]|uniref:Uncharacterized protein n=1 Tax=Actinokineospora auranticolor TaxID=155976 RepID=A0A2S6GIY0_9PSEU|nr:hypothetical protein [Actinokineospora auranticolor]PPK65111.1 hypothetical protein CLV40_116154 [Actinokineospora auranticolor]